MTVARRISIISDHTVARLVSVTNPAPLLIHKVVTPLAAFVCVKRTSREDAAEC